MCFNQHRCFCILLSFFVDLPCESCPCRCRVVRVAEARIWILDPNNGIRDCSSNCRYHGYHDEDDCKNGSHEDGNNNACCLLASLPCVPSPSLAGLALPSLALPCLLARTRTRTRGRGRRRRQQQQQPHGYHRCPDLLSKSCPPETLAYSAAPVMLIVSSFFFGQSRLSSMQCKTTHLYR